MMTYSDPTIPTGLSIMSRAYAKVLIDDVTFLADAISLLPLHAVAHGTGAAGSEGIPLAENELLTVRYGRTTFIAAAPPVGTYELTVGANGIPYWAEV